MRIQRDRSEDSHSPFLNIVKQKLVITKTSRLQLFFSFFSAFSTSTLKTNTKNACTVKLINHPSRQDKLLQVNALDLYDRTRQLNILNITILATSSKGSYRTHIYNHLFPVESLIISQAFKNSGIHSFYIEMFSIHISRES